MILTDGNLLVPRKGNITFGGNGYFRLIPQRSKLSARKKVVKHDVLISGARLTVTATKDSEQPHVTHRVFFVLAVDVFAHLAYYISDHFRRNVFLKQALSVLEQLNYQIVDELLFLLFQNLFNMVVDQVTLDCRVEQTCFEQQLVGLLTQQCALLALRFL
jgi:hypothetical protein